MKIVAHFYILLFVFLTGCADKGAYLSGHIRRASDAIMTNCDPYNQGVEHSCIVYSASFRGKLLIYDATTESTVFAPNYFPLAVKVGSSSNNLAVVKSPNKKFPYFFVLDRARPGLFIVRTFPSSDGKTQSFSTPHFVQLKKKYYKMAAFEHGTMAVVLLSDPNESSIDIIAFDKVTGQAKGQIQKIAVGVKPSHIEIDENASKAVISDEDSQNIAVVNLANIDRVLGGSQQTQINMLNVGMMTDRIFLSSRDFGFGKKIYLIAINAIKDEIALANISDMKVETRFQLKEYPEAIYFPDSKSESCCGGKKNWLAVAGVNGSLYYLAVNKEGGSLSLKQESEVVDLKSKHNMFLSFLQIGKIIGGTVIQDSSIDKKTHCPNNRRMFIVSHYGSDKPSLIERDRRTSFQPLSVEVEGQGEGCEGSNSFARLGFKQE
ncbi:MAG: hypothetical protein H6731_06610 [Myxococcales bacterium]|nr:MAG: hypothetical protein H6731_06610 [Myxococcales bacterium]